MREFQNKFDVKVSISCMIMLVPLKKAVWNLCDEISESCALRRFIFLFDCIGRMSPTEEKRAGKQVASNIQVSVEHKE